MSPVAANSISSFGISLGAKAQDVVEVGLPVLGGESVERLFGSARHLGRTGPLDLYAAGEWLLGAASVSVTPGTLERETRSVYHWIFEAAQAHAMHLARIWNYVPAINAEGAGGLENYRVFCRGRSLAFEQRLGAAFTRDLPSASAVGTGSPFLTVVFAASRSQPRHFENPLQLPAYEYPEDYGPRSPSFARATVVKGGGSSSVFISGTAAIRGHVSMAPGDIREQLRYTLENLESIAAACGAPFSDFRGGGREPRSRAIKVYLRDARDQPVAAQMLQARFLRAGDTVSYLRADICRQALSVEIEVTLIG